MILLLIITFSRGLAKFIDNEMKKQGSSANTDMMKVLDFLGKLNSFSKSQGQKGNTLGDQIPDPEKAKSYVNSTLGIGFTTLNLLVRKGTEINDSISLFVFRGDDKALLGVPDSEQRNLLIEQLNFQYMCTDR